MTSKSLGRPMRISIAESRLFAAATTGTPPAMTSRSPFLIPATA
eukprot:CAMPEP_0182550246 /NCGR_PEP_ID=MMETSP1323-20130603/41363_1 /TAXON_ID=236787 /ORGANISM="Florenciella parvula, Strain RCC1693" /LENGTH=43 /DNA_ID= /DNA_START= /DNA_END= /DNA_ORIENTATION=